MIEIERRFLAIGDGWRGIDPNPQHMRQGYLKTDKECSIRVRITDSAATLAIKGFISNATRHEFEYPIPRDEAELIYEKLCTTRLEKTRHTVPYGGYIFEIDEYNGENAPLVLIEIELPDENTPFARPDWLGKEVTADARYTNACLSRTPFSRHRNIEND